MAGLAGSENDEMCPKCQGVLELKGKKLVSHCGWTLEFGRRKIPDSPKR